MKPDEGDITHMAKTKLSQGFELIGEHVLRLQKCERGADAVVEVRSGKLRAQVEIALADVTCQLYQVSDKIPFYPSFSFFRPPQLSSPSHGKNDLLPTYTHISRR